MSIPTDMSFTPDWSKKTDYTEQYPFKSVVFPKNAPLLAEDLNEVQAILNKGINGLGKLMLTDGVIPINPEGWLTNVDSKTTYPTVNGPFYFVHDGEIFEWSGEDREYTIDTPAYPSQSPPKNILRLMIHIVKKTIDENTELSLHNYLAENDFGVCVSHRDVYNTYVANTRSETETSEVGEGYYDIAKWDDALGKWVPIYCKLKIDSNQGDTIITDINNFKAETLANIELAFNSFVSKTTIISKRDGSITETDANGNVKNTVFTSDTQIDETLTYNGVTYTKTTVFGTDDSGNEKITETVTVQEGA